MQKFQLLVDDKLETIAYIEFMQTLIPMPVARSKFALYKESRKRIVWRSRFARLPLGASLAMSILFKGGITEL